MEIGVDQIISIVASLMVGIGGAYLSASKMLARHDERFTSLTEKIATVMEEVTKLWGAIEKSREQRERIHVRIDEEVKAARSDDAALRAKVQELGEAVAYLKAKSNGGP